MKLTRLCALLASVSVAAASCSDDSDPTGSLQEQRAGFETELLHTPPNAQRLGAPPPEWFSLVEFDAPLGSNQAYLSRAPMRGERDDRKFPAMIWMTGGFPPGGIDSSAWLDAPTDNDQSAKAYRLAGLVMMYPTLRGSFGNPGVQEAFLGEVDDVLAAADFLAGVDYVDPERIYLGGHSTGGTLVMLVAAASDRFRGVIAFGPVEDPANYGPENLPYDIGDARERRLRAPVRFLDGIRSPTFVIEGTVGGNAASLTEMARVTTNEAIHFIPIPGASHFDLLAPLNERIAIKIAALGKNQELALTQRELQAAFRP